MAVLGTVALVLLAIFVSPWFLLPLAVHLLAIWIMALASTRSIKIATLAVPASIIQLGGYGTGFLKAYFNKIILGKGRNIEEEVMMRKGK